MITARIKRVIQSLIYIWIFKKDGVPFVRRYKWLRSLIGYTPEIEWDSRSRLYHVSENRHSMYLPRRERLKFYKNGVESRLSAIKQEYLVDNVTLADNDIIIDIGANIGEFAKSLGAENELRFIAIEPESEEFSALQVNLAENFFESHEVALWSDTGKMQFYPMNESGDSSLIPQLENAESIEKDVVSLDDLLLQSQLVAHDERIKLVKLEAEGAEPEILQGMKKTLSRIEYITADLGAERGVKKESTLVPVLLTLMEAGFLPIQFGLPRAVMLFRNSNFVDS